MKKILLITLAIVGLYSCKKPVEPQGTLTAEGSTQVAHTGGEVKLHITSNVAWKLVAEQGVTVNPSSGNAGDHIVVATVAPNTAETAKEFTITATFTNPEGTAIKKELKLSIEAFVPSPNITLKADGKDTLPFYGGEFKYELESNYAWVAVASEGVVVNPTSGEAGKFEVIATLPANDAKEKAQHTIKFTATNIKGEKSDKESILFVDIPYVSDKDGNQYKIVRLKDGRIWMAENMRLIPSGGNMTASSDITWLDPAFYCPLVIGEDGSTVDFSRKDEDIKSQGLYYSTARAFGLEDDTQLTAENAESFEGCQGICPNGWHIPTAAEMIALVGKCSNKDLTDTEAAYYDATLDNGSLEKLNADGANFKAYGAISVANTAAAKGVMLKVLNADSSDFNTGYFIGSTVYQISKNTDGTLKNMQYYGFMPNVKNGTMNVAYNNYRNGVSLRCIKTQE